MRLPHISRNAVLLIAAVGLGALASVLTLRYIHARLANLEASLLERQQSGRVTVVVAKADLSPGTQVSYANMATRSMPEGYVPAKAISPGAFDKAIGRHLRYAMKAGTPLLWPYLGGGVHRRFSSTLPAGDLALALQVGDVNSVSRLVHPGDKVDLLYVSGSGSQTRITTLLQGVPVLATGRMTSDSDPAPPGSPGDASQPQADYTTVTLQVSAHDAERIILAQHSGTLRVALRNPSDNHKPRLPIMTAASLFGGAGGGSEGIQFIVGGGSQSGQARVNTLPVLGLARLLNTLGQAAAAPPPQNGATLPTAPPGPAARPTPAPPFYSLPSGTKP